MVRHVWDLGKLVLVGKLCDTSQHSPPSYRRVKFKGFLHYLGERPMLCVEVVCSMYVG